MLGAREKSNIVVGIDIGTASVKTIAIERQEEQLVLKNYNELYLAKYAGREVGEYVRLGFDQLETAIIDSYNELKVTPNKIIIGIPASESFFKRIVLPTYVVTNTKDPFALENILILEFKKNVPAIEILNYKITHTIIDSNDKEITYLIMAVKEEYIKMIQDIAINKLKVDYIIEPNIFGGIRLIPFFDQKENIILVNIGSNNINVAFVNEGKMVGVENIEQGVNKIIYNVKNSLLISYEEARSIVFGFDYSTSSIEGAVDTIKLSTKILINEVVNTFNNYEIRYNVKYSKVFIGGSCANIKNTKAFYQENTGKEVSIINPFDRVYIPVTVQDILKENSSVFMNALGLALNNI